MDKCAFCEFTHIYPGYSTVELNDGTKVQVCNHCMDMSHEDWFYHEVNNKILGMRKKILDPQNDTEQWNIDRGKYILDGTYTPHIWVLSTEMSPS